MKLIATSVLRALAAAAVLGLVPAVLAHGGEENAHSAPAPAPAAGGHGGGHGHAMDPPRPDSEYPPNYFSHPDHKAVIYAHIALMVLDWVFILPAAVMLSLARSRYTLVVQFVFLAINGGAVFLGILYNASTPDLYPNNAHHKLGWIVTFVFGAQVAISLLARVAGYLTARKSGISENARSEERQGFIPVSTEAMVEHEAMYSSTPYHRFSNDSGHGTEPRTESLRSHSLSSPDCSQLPEDANKEYNIGSHDDDDSDEDLEAAHLPMFKKSSKAHEVVANIAGKISNRFWKVLLFAYNFIDRTILILGFITLCTGIATYGRFFEGSKIFSGLAHWIKGGVFFWLGIFTLGRWAGCFGELGWAWNIRPKIPGQKWRPTAEFVESAAIFFYGSTNIFLEHLGGWGGEWTPTDLEHLSITVLFIGGGLCGMLIESSRIRSLLNYTVTDYAQITPRNNTNNRRDPERNDPEELQEPETYKFSMNPIPALVILLLGIMMSSHTQETMMSSMVHKQWGDLLAGASFARALSYLLIYLKPPKSVYPSRPPTELLTSFGLIAGGLIFMASASDTVDGMIHKQLDVMFLYTVTMGLVGLMMAYTLLMISLKNWARRKEMRAAGRR